jgi:hypothetical protein
MAQEERILILGSDGYGRPVRSHAWSSLPSDLNVADYDTLILDFTGVEGYPASVILNPPPLEQFARLIFSEGSLVIAIGSPDREIQMMRRGEQNMSNVTTTWWMPFDLAVVREGGQTIENVEDEWGFWFERLDRYEWYFSGKAMPAPKRMETFEAVSGANVGLITAPVASTRFGSPLALSLSLGAYRDHFGEASGSSGQIWWLPPLPKMSGRDSIELLLRERFGVRMEARPPEWAHEFMLPRHEAALSEMEDLQTDLANAVARLEAGRARVSHEGRFTKLLYEQGEDVLEPLVWDALRELGATVEEPTRAGVEDGRFTDPQGRPGMLEIKGRSGVLPLNDLRQLDGWIRTALAEEEWSGKGLLVGNLKLDAYPMARDDVVAPNALTFSRNADICILTTAQLFRALDDLQRDDLDLVGFWDSIFESSGLSALPGIKAATKPHAS